MSFKNLEQRYNETVKSLYAGATLKFDNGAPSNGRNDDPLIVRKPGDGYWNFAESRSTPISSATQDVKRLTLFTTSVRGIKFLAKQQLLQTGNTFESTRIINPLFTIGNAVPFVRLKRSLDVPITARGVLRNLVGDNVLSRRIFGSGAQKTDTTSLKRIAQLQQETYNKLSPKSGLHGAGRSLLTKIPVIGPTISAASAKRSMGEVGDGWKESRPELASSNPLKNTSPLGRAVTQVSRAILGSTLTDILTQYDAGYIMIRQLNALNKTWQNNQEIKFTPRFGPSVLAGTYTTYFDLTNNKKDFTHFTFLTRSTRFGLIRRSPEAEKNDLKNTYDDSSVKSLLDSNRIDYGIINRSKWYQEEANSDGEQMPYLKYFTGDRESITDGAQFDPQNLNTTNAKYIAETRTDKSKKISYIKDPSNETVALEVIDGLTIQPAYALINNTFDDSIYVSFAMGNNTPVSFRAYITDLTQTATPEYKPYQYIGRIEKFITYTSVQRQISFKLGILAYSKDEIEGVWRRLNYLTGLVFPYGYVRGIYQPNIVRLTIGDIYDNQPGYLTSLTTNFTELSETWDLDRQVPIAATSDISFTLIEKNTKVADSPFYGITEGMEGFTDRVSSEQPDVTYQTNEAPAGSTLSNIPRSQFRGTPGLGDSVIFLPPNPFPSNRFRGFGGGGGFSGGGGGTSF